MVEFSPTGTQLARIDTSATVGSPGAVALDSAGDLFVQGTNTGSVYKYPANGSGQVEAGVFTQLFPVDSGATGVAVDTAANALYVALGSHVNQYDAATLVAQGEFGEGTLGATAQLAVNVATGNVYVSDAAQTDIAVFGPTMTGTVPDPAIEATTEIGINKAKFNGKVNPQSVPNSYFFQWKRTGSSWGGAQTSPSQSLHEDSTDHAVSFHATGLTGNRTYQVRLVVANAANNLNVVSGADTFITATAAAPTATMEPASPVGTTTATLNAKVNPREDTGTTYQFQTSTDPACASGFSNRSLHQLESESSTPVVVSEGLSGLQPHQHYCARITATNSGGTATSTSIEFTTAATPPDQVFTAFAAPRTDTSARLNGRVNPEGLPLTYRFEYSEDGGATWIELPEGEDTSAARQQIVLGEELPDLTPDTTYSYRFSTENEAGEATPQGEAKTFATRTSAEMQLPQRGVELVNNPDKGNQNVFIPLASIASPDGDEAIWSELGGAPGAPNGSQSSFLAERTGNGWQSRSIAPPAAQQLGGGSLVYELDATTPDFSRFFFSTHRPNVFSSTPGSRVRLDRSQNQDVLRAYDSSPREVDLSDDGAQVLALNESTKQLEEIGSGVPEVVSLMPDGSESSCGLDLETGRSFIGGLGGSAKSATGVERRPGYHMIAATDASRVYFGARPNGECGKPFGLYVRNRETEETTLIDPGTGADVAFIRASADGRSAYFATRSKLDPVDTNTDVDVYRWDEESGESTCLSCVVADAKVESGDGFYNPVLVSDDSSHVYFESAKQLVAGLGGSGRSLYVLSGGTIRFVAETNRENSETAFSQAELSSDGNELVFTAQAGRDLTADEVSGNPVELYRYEDREGSLECISCRHDALTTQAFANGVGTGGGGMRMSSDGATVAFGTAEALVGRDVNRGLDVYEWRNGARQLITDGVTEFGTEFAQPHVRGMDAAGANVFFTVTQPGLTGFEQDGLANLYDARIGGGFVPPSPPVHCSEDSCQGPLQAPPVAGSSGSASFSGAGNQRSGSKPRRPCAKKHGKARQRCLRKHKRHPRTARANRGMGRTK